MYPTVLDIRKRTPYGAKSVPDELVQSFIDDWRSQVADAAGTQIAPVNDAEAEGIVASGAFTDTWRQLLFNDGYSETPGPDRVTTLVRNRLTRYDSRHSSDNEPGTTPYLVTNTTSDSLFSNDPMLTPEPYPYRDGTYYYG